MTDEEKSPDWKGYGIDQVVVEQWVRTTFGDKMFESKEERAARVLEEAVELYQVFGPGNRAKAHKIVDMVFDKKVGELHNELGGLIVTLLAVCGNEGLRLDEMANKEITRIKSLPGDGFRKKQRDKADLGVSMRAE
jgi:hypothetical protein